MKGQIIVYNLPTEIKLHILNFLPYEKSKKLYVELNCNYIPTNIIKNYFYSFVLTLLPKSKSGSLTALIAYGAQDVLLLGNSQVSFF